MPSSVSSAMIDSRQPYFSRSTFGIRMPLEFPIAISLTPILLLVLAIAEALREFFDQN